MRPDYPAVETAAAFFGCIAPIVQRRVLQQQLTSLACSVAPIGLTTTLVLGVPRPLRRARVKNRRH